MRRRIILLGALIIPRKSDGWLKSSSGRNMCTLRLAYLRGGSAAPSPPESEQDDIDSFVDISKIEDEEDLLLPDHQDVGFDKTSSIEADNEAIPEPKILQKTRHTSDFLTNLTFRSGIDSDLKSQELRQLISGRRDEYIADLLSSPKPIATCNERLLQYLAPKIPAIKSLPEISLRVQSRKSDLDPGVAAALIGTLAYTQELSESCDHRHNGEEVQKRRKKKRRRRLFLASEHKIVEERRFEQLVECMLCGINVKQRTEEHEHLEDEGSVESRVEVILRGKDNSVNYSPGLSIRDACRAAWGLAVLGVHRCKSIGGEDVLDILVALSLRVRELLMARLELLRRDDLLSDFGNEALSSLPLDERISVRSEELAEDVATAMWTFGCVRVCTGLRSVPLFEICASILCQDPYDLRRRAQEEMLHLAAGDVGVNDVVDRIAECQGNSDQEQPSDKVDTPLEPGQVLLDWLGAQEIIDVVWSMALHDTREKDESTLSENTNILAELAFDRIMILLHKELDALSTSSCRDCDAEGIDSEQSELQETQAETIMIHVDLHGESKEEMEVEVVDASSILDPVQDPGENESAKSPASSIEETVSISASEIFRREEEDSRSSCEAPDATIKEHEAIGDMDDDVLKPSIFTAHDLCSLVWVATELRDSLRPYVMKAVADIFIELGEKAVLELDSGDLSNLAWALAKSGIQRKVPASVSLGEWIAKSALQSVREPLSEGVTPSLLLEHFQPPELSRLLWSIPIFLDPSLLVSQGAPKELSALALRTAASHQEVFGPEDLARILWAFLDLHRFSVTGPSSRAILDIGILISTIETSLSFWEKMTTNSVRHIEHEDSGVKDSVRFASFFGRTRFHFPLLDQSKDNDAVNDDADEFVLPSKSRLPLLRDIPVDPSTLCKLASSLHMSSNKLQILDEASCLTRVVVRLLASRSGRLLRACPIQDLVKLCNTIAISNASISRETLGLFVRRVLRLLNEETDLLKGVSVEDRATMFFALGELGAKYQREDSDVHGAYRRLHWTDSSQFFLLEDLKTMSDEAVVKSIIGMVKLNVAEWQESHLAVCVEAAAARVESFSFPLRLAESVALVKSCLTDEREHAATLKPSSDHFSASEQQSDIDSQSKHGETTDIEANDQSSGSLRRLCDHVLSSLAPRLQCNVPLMTISEIRRVLEVYSISAVQSDKLIEAIRRDLVQRRNSLSDLRDVDFSEIMKFAADSAAQARRSLFGDEHSDYSSSLRNRVVSFFTRNDEAKDDEQTDDNISPPEDFPVATETEQLQCQLESTLQATLSLSSFVETLEKTSHADFGVHCRSTCDNALFEIGRCEELLALYSRIDFSAGTRASRFDHEQRRDLAKHMLTRLLPITSSLP